MVYCQRPCLNILEANNVSAPPFFLVVPRCVSGWYDWGPLPWGTGENFHQIFQGAKAKGIREDSKDLTSFEYLESGVPSTSWKKLDF